MLVDLATPTTQALKEFNERAERPYIIADTCLLDGGAVELEIGGVTIAGTFHPEDAYALALGVLDMESPEKPADRLLPAGYDPEWDETELFFMSPEETAALHTVEELEYIALSALQAIAIHQNGPVSPVTAPVAAAKPVEARESVETVEAPQNATQSVSEGGWVRPDRIRFDFMWNRDAYYPPRPVEPLAHEEVAARFDGFVTGAAA